MAATPPTCAICDQEIPGRILFCPEHQRLVPTPLWKAVQRYWTHPGPYSREFLAACDAAVKAATSRLHKLNTDSRPETTPPTQTGQRADQRHY